MGIDKINFDELNKIENNDAFERRAAEIINKVATCQEKRDNWQVILKSEKETNPKKRRDNVEQKLSDELLEIWLKRVDDKNFSLDNRDDTENLITNLGAYERASKKTFRSGIYEELSKTYNRKDPTSGKQVAAESIKLRMEELKKYLKEAKLRQKKLLMDSRDFRNGWAARIFSEIKDVSNSKSSLNEKNDDDFDYFAHYCTRLGFTYCKDDDRTRSFIREKLEEEKVDGFEFEKKARNKLRELYKIAELKMPNELWAETLTNEEIELARTTQKQVTEFSNALRAGTINELSNYKETKRITDEQLTNELKKSEYKITVAKNDWNWKRVINDLTFHGNCDDLNNLDNCKNTIKKAIDELYNKNLSDVKNKIISSLTQIAKTIIVPDNSNMQKTLQEIDDSLDFKDNETWEDKVKNDCNTLDTLHDLQGKLWLAFNKLRENQQKEKEKQIIDLLKDLEASEETTQELAKETEEKPKGYTSLEHIKSRINKLEDEIAAKRTRLQKIYENHDENISKVFGIELTNNDFNNLEESLSNLSSRLEDKKKEIDKEKEELETNLYEKIKEKDNESNDLRTKKEELEASLKKLEEEKAASEKDKETILEILQIGNEYLANDFEKLRDELNDEELEGLKLKGLINQKLLVKKLRNDVDNLEELLKKAQEQFSEELKKRAEQYTAFVEQQIKKRQEN